MPARAQLLERFESGKAIARRLDALTKHIGLTKVARSYVMAASAYTAYVAQRPSFDWLAMQTVFSLFLVCLGAATLNNYQDRDIDGRLGRTRQRPLAMGELGARTVLLQAAALILGGTLGLLVAVGSSRLAITGLLGVCLYNLVYTPLKRRTVLAIVPGAVCGVLPILMGWMAAGGELASPKVWILMAVFGVWQLPHFWLVVLASRQDYRESGLPSMLRVLSERQLGRLVFVWVAAFAVLTMLLPLYRVVESEAAAWGCVANGFALTSVFGFLLFSDRGDERYRDLFRYLSFSVALVMTVIVFDAMA